MFQVWTTTLDLVNNQLSGPIPSEVGRCDELSWLQLIELQSTLGTNSDRVGSLDRQGVALNGNQLTGTLPEELGLLTTNLTVLVLDRNQLSGSLPPALGLMNALERLILGDGLEDSDGPSNLFTGTIPTELALCTDLDITIGFGPVALFGGNPTHGIIRVGAGTLGGGGFAGQWRNYRDHSRRLVLSAESILSVRALLQHQLLSAL
ncbi:STYKc [Seminavis robusta]|uniref:STYKc n=1 Tax=Seminavis robusta TaxID=568900 RepID=A0A9N8ED78_9STRA|nr:STYKc [Seminavis robusta]|eukprot:Sro823_g207520.1 STYKc (206) ;mRNA; f:5366-5983